MKLKVLFTGLIILIISLTSCEDKTQTTQVQNKSDVNNTLSMNYTSNPYNWAGQLHNDALGYILSNFTPDTIYSPLPDNNLIDSVAFYTAQHSITSPYNGIFVTAAEIKSTNLLNYSHLPFSKIDSLINFHLTTMYNNNLISNLDYTYSMRLYNIVHMLHLNNSNISVLQDSVINLESEMLNTTWGNNDKFAFYSLAILKYSIDFNINYENTANKKINLIQRPSRRAFAVAMVDYGTAVCAVGVATASANPAAIGVVLAKSAWIGAGASGTFDYVASAFLGLW